MAVNNIGDKLFFKDVSGAKYSEGIRKRASDAYSDSARENAARGSDTVSLSTDSRDMQVARNAVNAASMNTSDQDISNDQSRDQRIAGLKELYSSGRYIIEPEKIAEKLIGAHFNETV